MDTRDGRLRQSRKPAESLIMTLILSTILVALSLVSFVTLTQSLKGSVSYKPQFDGHQNQLKEYSYLDHDFPHHMPSVPPMAGMFQEESVHYTLEDELEWLYTSPHGTGTYRAGDNNRVMFIAMYHSLHCLRVLRHVLGHSEGEGESSNSKGANNGGGEHGQWAHLQHCLDYLRRWILCEADSTLELADPDFMSLVWGVHSNDSDHQVASGSVVGAFHVCRDWEAVYDETTKNWIDWVKYVRMNRNESST